MQNILIICADKNLRKDISRVLSTELNFLYIDVDEVLDFELLNLQDVMIHEAKDVMKNLERKSIDRALKFKDCVVTMSRDLFVSNDNFMLMRDYKKVFVSLPKAYFVARGKNKDKYTFEQELALFDKINKLVSINCDIVIEKEVLSIQEISNQIIERLNIK